MSHRLDGEIKIRASTSQVPHKCNICAKRLRNVDHFENSCENLLVNYATLGPNTFKIILTPGADKNIHVFFYLEPNQ